MNSERMGVFIYMGGHTSRYPRVLHVCPVVSPNAHTDTDGVTWTRPRSITAPAKDHARE